MRWIWGKGWMVRVAGLLIVVTLGLGSLPAARGATTITVTTTADELTTNGNCSLREAVQAANTDTAVDTCPAGSGADTIVVPAGVYTLSIAGAAEDANASGDLDITSNLTINGAGAATTIIDGADLDRVFQIIGAAAEISGATIQNGSPAGGVGGGISNFGGTLTLNNSIVSGNTDAGNGGGIFSGGTGTLTLNSSTVSGNTTTGNGGGIFIGGPTASDPSTLVLNNSTISNNIATGSSGGGIFNENGALTLANSTVSGNTSPNGGGIYSIDSTLTLTSNTVSGNIASSFGGIANFGTGTLKDTLIANNTPDDCAGSITSAGHNLIEISGCTIAGDTTIIGADPLLGALADNGGPTQTHALLTGSPAIDAGSSDCPPPSTDQRGVTRPQGAHCDIGAYEYESVSYTFLGFFQPIDNNQPNAAKAGQTIPIKWRLTDANGVPISDPSSFVSVTSSPTSGSCSGIPDAIETYAGSSGLQYLGDGNWQFNWKTPKSYAGQCRTMSLNLNDGVSGRTATFIFK